MGTTTAPPLMIVNANLPRDPQVYVRDHATALRETLGESAKEHHDRHIPWHFEPFAPSKYGYIKRGAKYQKLKDRMGLPPLVGPNPKTSGNLKTEVESRYDITKTQTKATLKMRLPFKGGTGRLRLRPGQTELTSPQEQILHRIAELSAIAKDETKHLAAFIAHRYVERVNQPGVKRKIRASGN